MHEQSVRKYFFLALFLIGAGLSIVILWPFAKVIILAIALSSVLFPLYRFLKKHIKSSWFSSLLTIFIFLIVLCIPLFFVGTLVFEQSQSLYSWVVGHGGFDNITEIFNRSVENVFPGGALNLRDSIATMAGKFSSGVGSIFTATLGTIFSFFLVLLCMFYFLKDGVNWKHLLVRFIPLSDESGDKILLKLDNTINGVVKGYLLVAVIQGILMGIGLTVFNVPNSALLGLVTAVAALIPIAGTALVAIPTVVYLFVDGQTGGAIGLAIWTTFMVGGIDNLLNPYLVSKKIAIHPLLILFSVLGGLALMGPIGILIGPLAISFLYALSSVYKTEMKTN